MKPSLKNKKTDSPVRTRYTETDCLFPRGQHPDDRTNKEFLRELENKLFVKKVEAKAKMSHYNKVY